MLCAVDCIVFKLMKKYISGLRVTKKLFENDQLTTLSKILKYLHLQHKSRNFSSLEKRKIVAVIITLRKRGKRIFVTT